MGIDIIVKDGIIKYKQYVLFVLLFLKGRCFMNRTRCIPKENRTAAAILETVCALEGEIRREFEKIGLRESYGNILRPLAEHEKMTQLEIVKNTGLKPPTISITLKSMEQAGVDIREKSGRDRRETYVRLSPKGKKLCKKAAEAENAAAEKLLSGVSEEELEAFLLVLGKINDNMK